MFLRSIGAAVACALVFGAAAHAQTCPGTGLIQLTPGNLAKASDLMSNFACLAPRASPQFTGNLTLTNTAGGYAVNVSGNSNNNLGLVISNSSGGSSATNLIMPGNNTNSQAC